jgi:hypothetical protein
MDMTYSHMSQRSSSGSAGDVSFPGLTISTHAPTQLSAPFRAALSTALAFYPELTAHPLTIRWAKLGRATMAAQPRPDFWRFPAQERPFVIKVSSNLHLNHRVKLSEAPHEVLVGWLVHEMGHLMDYQRRSFWGMLRFGVGYLLSGRYRRQAEFTADGFALERGAGAYLLATKRFLLAHSHLSQKYKTRLMRYYPTPEDVIAYIEAQEEPLMPE